jgi:hypothetical protein
MYGVLAWKEGYAWDLQNVIAPIRTSINLSLSAEVGYHTHLQRKIGAEISLADRLLSLNRPTKMSPDEAPAPGGNDGIKNGAFGFKTPFDTHPWWQVDLGTDCIISEVRIFNSKMYQPEDAKYLEIRFSSDENSWVPRYRHDGSIPPYPLVIPFFNTIGRYVRVVLLDSDVSLHLDEVEVYGHPAGGPQPLSGVGAMVPQINVADLRIAAAVPTIINWGHIFPPFYFHSRTSSEIPWRGRVNAR